MINLQLRCDLYQAQQSNVEELKTNLSFNLL